MSSSLASIAEQMGMQAATAFGKVAIQTAAAQVNERLGGAVANAAGDLVTNAVNGQIDNAQALVDNLQKDHPAVQAAVTSVRSAVSDFIHIPTEDEIFSLLKYSVKSIVNAFSATPATNAATTTAAS